MAQKSALVHAAHNLIFSVCCLAGSTSLFELESTLALAIQQHNTPKLFQWLVYAFSFQGIADGIASSYIERHGLPSWIEIEANLEHASCGKLKSYWSFSDCGYRKSAGTCNEPDHFSACPLPRHELRNGRLNQIAYALFLFIRDIADGDLVTWIDRQLEQADQPDGPDRTCRTIESLIGPLRNIHGISDKVLMMSLSSLLLASDRPLWREVGANMIAVDTLVHNFLHRTGILSRFGAEHSYGEACYRPGACADVIRALASTIDASQFNRTYPRSFPRFVQNAIWRYCAQSGLNECNGNRIDDRHGCENGYCRLYWHCDRKSLKTRANQPHTGAIA
jgi:hypothetical protein